MVKTEKSESVPRIVLHLLLEIILICNEFLIYFLAVASKRGNGGAMSWLVPRSFHSH